MQRLRALLYHYFSSLNSSGTANTTCIRRPLLPASATGTVDTHSIVDPIRSHLDARCNYLEAECIDINAKVKHFLLFAARSIPLHKLMCSHIASFWNYFSDGACRKRHLLAHTRGHSGTHQLLERRTMFSKWIMMFSSWR